MSKFKKKPVVIEAITFEEFVQYGLNNLAGTRAIITNGMPWSFEYNGHPVTHENDDCYLVPTLEGTMRFNRGDMLITGIAGEIYPCKKEIFDQTYETVEETTEVKDSLVEWKEQWNEGNIKFVPELFELVEKLQTDLMITTNNLHVARSHIDNIYCPQIERLEQELALHQPSKEEVVLPMNVFDVFQEAKGDLDK